MNIRNKKQQQIIVMHWDYTDVNCKHAHMNNLRRYRIAIYIGKCDGYDRRNDHLVGNFVLGSLYLLPKYIINTV